MPVPENSSLWLGSSLVSCFSKLRMEEEIGTVLSLLSEHQNYLVLLITSNKTKMVGELSLIMVWFEALTALWGKIFKRRTLVTESHFKLEIQPHLIYNQ